MFTRLVLTVFLITGVGFTAFNQKENKDKNSWLYRFSEKDDGSASGYVNARGDTIVPPGKYSICYADTIKTFGTVYDQENNAFIGIDTRGKFLFEIFPFDNGPDYAVEGLFRIVKKGKIGYADTDGKIVIKPKFTCAHPFKDGKAKVAVSCSKKEIDEHSYWVSDEWFFIDKNGKKL